MNLKQINEHHKCPSCNSFGLREYTKHFGSAKIIECKFCGARYEVEQSGSQEY